LEKSIQENPLGKLDGNILKVGNPEGMSCAEIIFEQLGGNR